MDKSVCLVDVILFVGINVDVQAFEDKFDADSVVDLNRLSALQLSCHPLRTRCLQFLGCLKVSYSR
jgi:hypothetical protein